jgi:hypothetical protein
VDHQKNEHLDAPIDRIYAPNADHPRWRATARSLASLRSHGLVLQRQLRRVVGC